MKAAVGCKPAMTPVAKCNTFKTYFDPKIAEAAVTCMVSLSGAQVCDPAQVTACSKTALSLACTDPSVAQLCQIAAGPCKTSASDCAAMVSGLNDQGQQMVAQCVAQGCTAGLFACVDALK